MDTKPMIVFDGCCGLKGISNVFASRGWQTISLDIKPEFEPTIIADIREYHYEGPRPDLMWFSPPCQDFTRSFLPWIHANSPPDLSIVKACKQLISEVNPRYWVIENVKGAQRWLLPFLGKPRQISGPFYLWGYFPPLSKVNLNMKQKQTYTSARKAERAMIHRALAYSLAIAIENQNDFFSYPCFYNEKNEEISRNP
ncbi:MAG: hypothetical protein A2Z04_01550 [Chloroflexi bacterium RBG_16_57_9]|nr:MAG: hypothetical protein A2Z04_01550 [Chloroflexi bacterium RBG_16_57_9]